MKVYQIDYDLRKQRDYESLYERIRGYPNWCHPLESTWIVASQKSATQIRDDLASVMDSDDGLLVTRLQGEAAWQNLGDRVSQWLKETLNSCTV